MAAKTSPPPYDRSGIAGTRIPEELGAGAPEELVPDDHLLQRDQDQSQNKKRVLSTGKQENNSPTGDEGSIIVLFLLALDQGRHSTS